MTPARLRELIAAYGADPVRWPANDRAAARLAETDAEARQDLAEARVLDGLIGRHAAPALSLDAARLAARITATPQPRGFAVAVAARGRVSGGWPFAWPNFAALASVAIVGLVVGWTGLDASFSPSDDEDATGNLFAVVEDLPW